MLKIIKIIRSNEWWEYKFPPIFSVGYLIILKNGGTAKHLFPVFSVVLLALITGAAYVSILNDATDVDDDARARKNNNMADFNSIQKTLFVIFPLFVGLCFLLIFFKNSILVSTLYLLSYICFTLYSLPPFRLKKRGFAGVLADAAGSQLFPTLFLTAYIYNQINVSVNLGQFAATGIWSFCFGIRGILWHQFKDKNNDTLSGIKTPVQVITPGQFKIGAVGIMIVEMLSFTWMILSFDFPWVIFSLALYVIYVLLLYKRWHINLIIIQPIATPYRIFMNEYYQVFLPLHVLISVIILSPDFIFLLFLQLILFPRNIFRISKEFLALICY
ncbi:UbiA family prenyltransferase [Mucilaginibacter sp. UYCu711]|uniref:UbiA family prenyltransferase n=1 Tax=Mucilaginibacter sp. UYCu711 TaxID=3156339 RepID=UPI003D1DDC9C